MSYVPVVDWREFLERPVCCPQCSWAGLVKNAVSVPSSVVECPQCRAFVVRDLLAKRPEVETVLTVTGGGSLQLHRGKAVT